MSASARLRPFAPYLLLLLAIAMPLLNPIGYVGGAADDVHYLTAARCWVDAGQPCLAADHWATRWPAIAPIALFTGLFGESRLTVGIGPALAWLGCVLLLWSLARVWFDDMVAAVAALLFAAVPAVSQAALQPSVDATELAAQLGALWLANFAYARQSKSAAIAAGAAAAVAVAARDTSILFCAAAALAWCLLDAERRNVLLWAVAGFAGVVAAEMAAYALAAGDPLLRFRLALNHVALPSAELPPGFDTGRSPLFNPAYVAAWRPESGIRWWWPFDPWLNLIASPRTAFLFAGGLIAAAVGWTACPPEWRAMLRRLTGFALLVAAGLIYALAVDPKPRMFFALFAAGANVLGAIAVGSWRGGRGMVPALIVALVVLFGARTLSLMVNTYGFERSARAWTAAHPGAIEIDPHTRTTLTLVPEVRRLPAAGSGRPLRIAGSDQGCRGFNLPVVRQMGEPGTGVLCLLDAAAAAKPGAVRG